MLRSLAILLTFSTDASAAQLARIEGRVVDASGREGVAARVAVAKVGKATVLVQSATEMLIVAPGETDASSRPFSRILDADGDGRFAIAELEPGSYSLVAAHPERGYALLDLALAAESSAPLEIALAPPHALDVHISGREFDPRVHALVLKPERTLGNVNVVPRLAQHGWSFHAEALPPLGDWLAVGSELVVGHDYRATLFQLPVRSGVSPAMLEIDLASGIELSGEVLGPGGEALASVSVVAVVARSLSEPRAEYGAITDAHGRYSLRVPAAGAYRLEARRWVVREAFGCGNGPADVQAAREVELPLADPTDANLRIEHFDAAPAVGELAPDFETATLAGSVVRLSVLRGKVVLLDFWATTCAMCRADLPMLERLYAEHAAGGSFEIVAISIDEEPEVVRRFLESRALPWKHTALGPPESNPLTQLYNVWGTPGTFVVDRDGRIDARNLMGEKLRERIEALLAAK